MPQTPDRRPGATYEDDEIVLESNASGPSVPGAVSFNGTSFQMQDAMGVFDPRTGGAGVTDHGMLTGLGDDDHPQYQLRSEKAQPSGYASLDGAGKLPLPQLPLHKTTHEENGSDELFAENLGTASLLANKFMITDGLGGWLLAEAPAPAFGTEVHTAESAPTSTTTNAAFQNKLTLTTAALAGGTYILLFSTTAAGTANNTVLEVQIVENVTQLNLYQTRLTTANAEFAISGFKVLVLSGVQNFYINYRKAAGSGSASVKDARFALWRIG